MLNRQNKIQFVGSSLLSVIIIRYKKIQFFRFSSLKNLVLFEFSQNLLNTSQRRIELLVKQKIVPNGREKREKCG